MADDDWTEDFVRFLESKGACQHYIYNVREWGVDRDCLKRFQAGDYEKIGFKKAHAMNIFMLGQEYLGNKQKSKKKSWQEPRKFLQDPKEGYTYGAVLGREEGSRGQTQRIQEFKEFSTFDDKAFVKKLLKFAIACINSRQDGTIYFGVADDKKGQFAHGEVTGVSLDEERRHVIEEALDTHLRSRSPTQFAEAPRVDGTQRMICRCLRAYVVPVIGSVNERVVIEVDVHPTYEIFEMKVAYMQPTDDGKQYAWIRRGTQSTAYPLSDIEEEVQRNAKERLRNEATNRPSRDGLEIQLNDKLLRDEAQLEDRKYQYVLVADCFDQSSLSQKDFEWVGSVLWDFVIDLDPNRMMFPPAKENELEQMKPISLQEMKKVLSGSGIDDSSKLIEDIHFGQKSPWIHGYKVEPVRGSEDEGIKEGFDILSRTINCLTSDAAQEAKEYMVVVFLVNDMRLKRHFFSIFGDFYKKLNTRQIVCISPNNHVLRRMGDSFMEHFPIGENTWESIAVCCESWAYLNSYVKGRLKEQVPCGSKIASSAGSSGIEVPLEVIKSYQSKFIELLLVNHCSFDDPKKAMAERHRDTLERFKEFFRGASATWDLFYHSFDPSSDLRGSLPEGYSLVDRPRVQDIEKVLRSFTKGEDEVCQLRIFHESGSGATTMAMHALWTLRAEMRCVKVDGQMFSDSKVRDERMKAMAKHLFALWTYKEESFLKICPVLVLVDDAFDALSNHLKDELERQIRRSKQTSPNLKFILLTCQSSKRKDSEAAYEHSFSHRIKINQELQEVEKDLFARKLKELVKRGEKNIDSLFAFTIMANNFDKTDSYVVRFVNRVLASIAHLAKERRLLLYLSIFKFYGYFKCTGLPTRQCKLLVKGESSDSHSQRTLRHVVSDETGMCLIEKKYPFDRMNKGFLIAEVTHKVLAELLIDALLPLHVKPEAAGTGRALASVTGELFEENALIQKSFQRDRVHYTLRQLLVIPSDYNDAGLPASDPGEDYSKLITKVLSESGDDHFEIAFELLKVAHSVLRDDDKPFLSQTIARLLLNRNNNFKESRWWGEEAIKEAGEKKIFAFYDTVGQVNRREMRSLFALLQDKKSYSIHCEDFSEALKLATDAEYYFQRAQQYFNSYMSRGRDAPQEDQYSLSGGDSPGIMGRIEIRIKIFHLITCSVEFEGQKRLFEALLQQHGQKQRLDQLPETVSGEAYDVFNRHWDLISSIYHESKRLLASAAKNMTELKMDVLEEITNDFEDIFRLNVVDQVARKIVKDLKQQSSPTTEAVEAVIRFIDRLYIRNLSWNIGRNETTLRAFALVLNEIVVMINTDRVKLHASDMHQVRVCYVTCFLALFYHGIVADSGLQRAQAAIFIDDLISKDTEGCIWTELCNLYILICMIGSGLEQWTEDMQKKFHACLEQLKKQLDSGRLPKSRYLFRIKMAYQQAGRYALVRDELDQEEVELLGRMISGDLEFYICDGFKVTLPRRSIRLAKGLQEVNLSKIEEVQFCLRFTPLGLLAINTRKRQQRDVTQ